MLTFELFVEDDVFAGKEESWREEVVLSRLVAISLLIEGAFELFQVFAEHIFSTQLSPSSEVVDFGSRLEPELFEDPVDLLFFAPHDVPVISISLFPLAVVERTKDAVSK